MKNFTDYLSSSGVTFLISSTPLFLTSLLVINFALKILQIFQNKWKNEKDLKDFPECPDKHWLFGHLSQLSKNDESVQWLIDITKDYPLYLKIWMGPFVSSIFIHHPETVRAVVSTTAPKSELYSLLHPWLGDGLLLSSGNKWKIRRHLLTAGFHFKILKPYARIFNESTNFMLRKIETLCGKEDFAIVEIFQHASLMTLDSLLKCIFSAEINCQIEENHPYIRAVAEYGRIFNERVQFPPYYNDTILYFTPLGYRMRKTLKILHSFSDGVIKARRAIRIADRQQQRKYIDFLDIILSARDENGKGLSDKEIREEVDTFLFAGHDTTASAISYCLYNLAKNPEIQEKCFQEASKILNKKENEEIDWDDLKSLLYTTMCIKESLRMNGVIVFLARQLPSPIQLPDGKVLPAGQQVALNMQGLNHNPHVWDQPHIFSPERFSADNVKGRDPYIFIPFSAGSRNCIGQNFAMEELKITIALTIHKFKVSVDEKQHPVGRTARLTLGAENGIRLRFTRRGRPLTSK